MRIGRYRIFFSNYFWFQSFCPVTVRRFRGFTIVREARPTDVDRKKQFKLGAPMIYKGRPYRYYRSGGNKVERDICLWK